MKDKLLAFCKATMDAIPLIVRSPGRINLIGEHTDYNEGYVMPAAIDKAAWIAITLREDDDIHLFAYDLDENMQVGLSYIKPVQEKNWPNYILGVVAQFKRMGFELGGFNAVITSDIPIGAGLSSSAAISCATAFALNEVFKTGLEKIDLVKMAQQAEHDYAGVHCGIMDQFASMYGAANQVIRLDCRSLEYEYLPMDLPGYALVLFDTGVKHALASSAYNDRRKSCEDGVRVIQQQFPDVKSLRDVDKHMLQACLKGNTEVYKRCTYVIEEEQRVRDACVALQNRDIEALGQILFATHDGLKRDYEVSCRELDFLVDQVRADKHVAGARMMGGGFGGCTLNLVREEAVAGLISRMATAYQTEMGQNLKAYPVSIGGGTAIIR